MSLRSSILGPTSITPPGDPQTELVLPLPVAYPPRALRESSDSHFRYMIHTHLSPSRMTRIHSLIRAPFFLFTEALLRWNRLAPAIRPGLLAAVMTSVLIPVSCSLYFSHANYVTSFTVLIVAIHPLVYLLNFVIDDLAIRYRETIACLLHATTVSLAEVIVAVIGLRRNEPHAVQVSLLGSLIVNTLLIPGLCFFFGGLRLSNQHFNRMISHSKSPVVMLGLIAFILPSTLDPVYFVNEKPNVGRRNTTHDCLADRVVRLVISIIMLLTYVWYTVSQLLSDSFPNRSDVAPRLDGSTPIAVGGSAVNSADATVNPPSPTANSLDEHTSLESRASDEQYLGLETPKISTAIAVISLFGVCGLLVVVTVLLDDTLQHITQNPLMSKWFVSFILSPLVSNVPDAIAAVTASVNGKPCRDLAIAEAQSVQMTFFTIPLVTITAWGMGKSFCFPSDSFGSIVLALSTILTLFLNNERGTSPKGVVLMSTYLVVATTSWFYPGPSNATVPNLLTNAHMVHPELDT
ncbi:hypothetical protein H4582DRAFT_2104097 [Lactarius indigo]|nr:hypothetical protein H4582DRAFT_2104097 [Lactarius indigo]